MDTTGLNELAVALSKAQADMKGAAKDSTNPHFKSSYATLASIWEACRVPLTKNGLSVVQMPGYDNDTQMVTIETILLHTSGQQLRSIATAPAQKPDAQGIGSVITYLRRYALAAFVGIAPEDDDGEGSVSHSKPVERRPSYINAKGETVLPGLKAKWGGYGGMPITEVKSEILTKALAWFQQNNGEQPLMTAMEEELENRRQAAQDGDA